MKRKLARAVDDRLESFRVIVAWGLYDDAVAALRLYEHFLIARGVDAPAHDLN